MPNQNTEGKMKAIGKKMGNFIADVIAEALSAPAPQYQKEVTLKQCISWMKETKAKYPSSASCLIFTKDAPNPQTGEEGISVTLLVLDKDENPIALDKQSAVSVVFLAETIDDGLIHILNGQQAATINL